MSFNAVGPVKRAWLRWKSLRLPWRKRFLVGLDLQGNTFWEFKDVLSSQQGRMRRIVQYPSTVHYSDVSSHISPAWHQWLRHTRSSPPTLTEQSQDLVRQKNLRVLAAEADARWAAKPSYLDAPGGERGQPVPAIGVQDPGGYSKSGMETEPESKRGVSNAVGGGLDDPIAGTDKNLGDTIFGAEDGGSVETQQPDEKRHPLTRGNAREKDGKDDPWKRARGGPSEDWQPAAWNPSSGPTKR